MDGGGRLAGSLTRKRPDSARPFHAPRWLRRTIRFCSPLLDLRTPRGAGALAATFLILSSVGYGIVRGDHWSAIAGQVKDTCDSFANLAGFSIGAVAVSGNSQIARDEILTLAGVEPTSSLLFLDAGHAREELKSNPWIADATVLKLYPGRLEINVVERQAFALWQIDGRLSVIAADGAVLEPTVPSRFVSLPRVVGIGAEKQAKDFLTLLASFPDIAPSVEAAVLIAERRWNLRLKSGIDVRLPETNIEQALETLARLDRDKQLLSRDIVAVDLRLPDRITVRLSDAAAQARSEALKEKPKRKGSDA